jgi:hypothetical protein
MLLWRVASSPAVEPEVSRLFRKSLCLDSLKGDTSCRSVCWSHARSTSIANCVYGPWRDAPDAFGVTLADAEAQPSSYWEILTRSVTEPGHHVMFLACEGEATYGSTYGLLDQEKSDGGRVGGMGWTLHGGGKVSDVRWYRRCWPGLASAA